MALRAGIRSGKIAQIYKSFPEIAGAVCLQSSNMLSWSHHRILLEVKGKNAYVWIFYLITILSRMTFKKFLISL